MRTVAGVDWCRDVDYGNLPQWVALILGAVVGGFTIFGITTARSAYLDDVRTRKFAQARFVFGEVMDRKMLPHVGGEMFVKSADLEVERIQFPDSSTGSKVIDRERFGSDDVVVAREPAYVFVLKVHNGSDELISNVSVIARSKDRQSEIGCRIGSEMIRPKSAIAWVMALPERDWFDPREITVTFTDATGDRWIRRGAEPVEPSPLKIRNQARRLKDLAKPLSRVRR